MKKLGFLAIVMAIMLASCKDTESYSDRLNVERNATNAYLKTQRVVNEVPADSVFEIGKDAPFYRIDPEGNVYMQVLNLYAQTVLTGQHSDDKEQQHGGNAELGAYLGHKYGYEHEQGYEHYKVPC